MLRFIFIFVFIICSISLSFGQKRSIYPEKIDLEKIVNSAEEGKTVLLPEHAEALYVKANDLISSEFQSTHNVKSYDLHTISGQNVGSLVTVPGYVYYSIDNEEGNATSFYPNHQDGGYILEETTEIYWKCATEELKKSIPASVRSNIGKFSYGDDLQSFRLAIITTGEFYEQHGNSDDVVLAEIVKILSGVNRIFERDLSLNFRLGGRVKLYSDKNTDPYTPSENGGDRRTVQSARAFHTNFDAANYDVGITFNANSAGWPGGGLAVSKAGCDPGATISGPTKARVWAASDGSGSNGFTALVTHELGHAFGANHTMNAGSERCKDAVSATNAYEIGSGNTIMAYGGDCGEGEDYVLSGETINNYFHFTSLYQMAQYTSTLQCQSIVETVNTPPDITVNPCGMSAFQVPLSTPFSINAIGSDADGDDLTYVWEQFDEDGSGRPNAGFLGPEASLSSRGPLFRGYAMSASSSRDFPRFFNYFFQDPFETLSKVPRDLTLRCTVRDNDPEGGIFTSDEVTVNVLDVGPFLIEIDSLIDTIVGGETINLSWNDDGISGLCDRVDVSLISLTDGSVIIPVASDVAYSELGLQYFIAAGFSIEGNFHFKVECHVSDCFSFYSYSRPFFSTTNCPAPDLYFSCGLDDITANIGDEVLDQGEVDVYSGVRNYSENITIDNDNPFEELVRYSLAEECETLAFDSGNPVRLPSEFISFRVSESGTYRFANLGDDFAGLLVYDEVAYGQGDLCGALVGANVTESLNSPGTLVTSTREWADVELNACTDYLLGVLAFPLVPDFSFDFSISISGEAALSIQDGTPSDNTFFYVVENESGEIEAILPTADFTELRKGTKTAYTIKVDPETFVPSDFIGKLLVDLGLEGQCVGRSSNTTELVLINPLPDDDMDGYHTDEDCDDNDPNVNPDATEVLNNTIDENCDGLIEGVDFDMDGFNAGFDCDDMNAAVNPDAMEIANNDVDENCDGVILVIDDDMDGFNTDFDCDDMNAAVNPDAEEIANNGVDENCDGLVLVIDDDMDGFNTDVDCNDLDSLINPAAMEIPNNAVDENCDGLVIVIDEDMDGFNTDVDCNDLDSLINPAAMEIPSNAVDENCDGIVLNFDADMDGFNSEVDCDDSNAAINPDAEEIPNNDIDENCDGELLYIDADMDGFNTDVDCNDLDSLINPAAEEIPNNDIDENCDGAIIFIDDDMDGFNSTVDCNDTIAAINPGAEEIPNNNVDENCDGLIIVIDEDMDGFNTDDDCNDLDSLINPAAMEIPNNNIDENCNGELGFTDEDMDGFNGSVDCNDLDSLINPAAIEIPNNGIDENCDGEDLVSSVDESTQLKIEVYPNPTRGYLTVDIGDSQGRIEVYHVNGQRILESKSQKKLHEISLSANPPGVYFLTVNLESGRRQVIKLIRI